MSSYHDNHSKFVEQVDRTFSNSSSRSFLIFEIIGENDFEVNSLFGYKARY